MKSIPTVAVVRGKVIDAISLTDLTAKDLAILCKTNISLTLGIYLTQSDLLNIYKVKKVEDIPFERVQNALKLSASDNRKYGIKSEPCVRIAEFQIMDFEQDTALTKRYSINRGKDQVIVTVMKPERSAKGWYVPINQLPKYLETFDNKCLKELDGVYSIGDCFIQMKQLFEKEYSPLKFFSYNTVISKENYDKYFEFLSAFKSFNNDIAMNAQYFGWHQDGNGAVFQIRFPFASGNKARVIFYFPDTHSVIIFKGNKQKPFEIITDKSQISSLKDILIRNNTLK